MSKTRKARDYTPAQYANWVADTIEQRPDEYLQTAYYMINGDHDARVGAYECSSACCIAGWIAAYAADVEQDLKSSTAPAVASHVMNPQASTRTKWELEALFAAYPLFHWAKPYGEMYAAASQAMDIEGMAAAAAALLRAGCQPDGSWRMPPDRRRVV